MNHSKPVQEADLFSFEEVGEAFRTISNVIDLNHQLSEKLFSKGTALRRRVIQRANNHPSLTRFFLKYRLKASEKEEWIQKNLLNPLAEVTELLSRGAPGLEISRKQLKDSPSPASTLTVSHFPGLKSEKDYQKAFSSPLLAIAAQGIVQAAEDIASVSKTKLLGEIPARSERKCETRQCVGLIRNAVGRLNSACRVLDFIARDLFPEYMQSKLKGMEQAGVREANGGVKHRQDISRAR